MPVYMLPGNHDDRDQLRRSFPEHRYLGTADFVQYSVRIGELTLVALDTSAPPNSHGILCKKRLEWLEKTLAAHRGGPLLLAMHHPPFQTLIGHMDRIGLLAGAEELEAIVARYPNVERVICGHLHRAIDVRSVARLPRLPRGPHIRSASTSTPTLRRPGCSNLQGSGCTPGQVRGCSPISGTSASSTGPIRSMRRALIDS